MATVEYTDPTNVDVWVRRLKSKMEVGELLDLAPGEHVDRAAYATWPAGRTMPAAALRAVLTDPAIRVDPRGIQIRGARFSDRVDLEYVVFAHPLRLHECVLEQGLNANYAQTRGLTLTQVTINGGVLAKGATIEGQLDLTGATLNNPYWKALDLEGARITGNVVAADDFHATGTVWADSVTVGGNLDLTGATFNNPATQESPYRYALVLDNAQITGTVFAGAGLGANSPIRAIHVNGGVSALGAAIGFNLDLDGASLNNPDGDALVLSGARITGSVFGRKPFCVTGMVSAIGATIGATLDLDGASLNNPDGDALVLSRAHILADMFGQNGFCATGTVRAIGAIIGGHLHLDGATFNNPATQESPDRYALILDHAQITGNVYAREYAEADGETRGFHAKGMVRVRDVTIGGDLALTGATLDSPGTAGKLEKAALDLAGARVTGSVLAGEGAEGKMRPCHVEGTVRAVGATIGYQLDLSGATVKNPDGVALNLEAATVPRLVLTPKECSGSVNLVRTQVGDLVVDKYPPGPLSATGWTVGDLRGCPGSLRDNWRLAHRWLDTAFAGTKCSGCQGWWRRKTSWMRHNESVPVQPWYALADVYDRNGDPAAARRLRFAAENKVTAQSPPWTRIVRVVYCMVAGNGYFPLLSIASMIVVLAISAGMVQMKRGDIVPTHPDAARLAAVQHLGGDQAAKPWLPITAQTPCDVHPGYPCMQLLTFAVNDVLPPAGTSNHDWTVSSTASLLLVLGLPVVKLALWALAALFLAGVSGLLRKSKN